MKIELLVLIITGFFLANTYHEGKYIAILKSWKKYYQMAGIAFAGLSAYLFLKKYPNDTRTLLTSAAGVVKYLPIDKDAGDMFSPLIDMTKKTISGYNFQSYPDKQSQKILNSGNNTNNKKRCVSETKKKFVAANQNWTCGECNQKLPAWFEVDHKVRLDRGGTNHVDNLVALCRNCHGKKTALENL
jgi:hypothetical protein